MSRAEALKHNKEMLDLWRNAEKAVAGNQSYTIAGKTLTRVDADVIFERVSHYEKKVRQLESGKSGGIRFQRTITLDD